MNLPALLAAPVPALLLKWTCLLALGWVAHGLLRRRHARARLILWRSLLGFSLILPLVGFIPLPGIRIPVNNVPVLADESLSSLLSPITPTATAPAITTTVAPKAQSTAAAPVTTHALIITRSSPRPFSLLTVLLDLWLAGCLIATVRLLRWQWQLSKLRQETHAPAPALEQLAQRIQSRLQVRRAVSVRLSDTTASPFICGVWQPVIILPRALAHDLSADEISALLGHELAHLRQNDLAWCVAWRWMQVLCWFHPLVWRIPSAHNLACEQEADRIASSQLPERESYAQLLAQLALRILTLPTVETRLTMNGSSQIARRLGHLAQPHRWNWKYTAAGGSVIALVFLLTAGCQFTSTKVSTARQAPLQVTINSQGQIFYKSGFTALTLNQLQIDLMTDATQMSDKNHPIKLAIIANQDAAADVVNSVIDIAKRAGIKDVQLDTAPAMKFDRVQVEVRDEDDQPIAGATVVPNGFRVKGLHGADAYGWDDRLFGSPEKAVTDSAGNAYVKYPVEAIPDEKEDTGALILVVSCPGYSTAHVQTFYVDQPEKPVQLNHAVLLAVSGYFGPDHQRVPELAINVNEEMIQPTNWLKSADSIYTVNQLSPGLHLLQLMGRMPDGQVVFSEVQEFTAERGKPCRFDLEMKRGIRVEGRLDDQVPRPVKNGRVLIDVRPPQIPAWTNYDDMKDVFAKYQHVTYWRTYRTIAGDGTFVFESVPPGGLDVVAIGDGFISKSGGAFGNKNGKDFTVAHNFCLPQPFTLTAPMTQVEIVTEPSATLEVTAKTPAGQPIAGAHINLNPNVVRMNGIFGDMRYSDETPFRTLPHLSYLYQGTTDQNGHATIKNVPAFSSSLDVFDTRYQLPLQDPKGWRNRSFRLQFSPGETNHLALTLEPIGSDYIGSR